MDAPENFFLPLPLYHLLTSDKDITWVSLRQVFAVSTFASERIVRKFTALEASLQRE